MLIHELSTDSIPGLHTRKLEVKIATQFVEKQKPMAILTNKYFFFS